MGESSAIIVGYQVPDLIPRSQTIDGPGLSSTATALLRVFTGDTKPMDLCLQGV